MGSCGVFHFFKGKMLIIANVYIVQYKEDSKSQREKEVCKTKEGGIKKGL